MYVYKWCTWLLTILLEISPIPNSDIYWKTIGNTCTFT